MSEPSVTIERRDAVTVLRLNEPATMNALSPGIRAGLSEGAEKFFADPEQHCLVVIGAGKAFCAGGDIRAMTGERKPVETRARLQGGHRWVRLLMEGEKPVIMAVNGAAVGAGLSLALMGDIVMAAEDAYFMGGFVGVGVVPDLGLLYSLPRAIGLPRAKDLLFSNRRVTAAEALAMGLVSRVAPTAELEAQALALAAQIAAGPMISLGLTKSLLRRAFDTPLESFLESEALAQATNWTSADFTEGVAAFLGKRKPRFTGR
jgi:2-(1,2-epoxy-1,2-dihydrophenyl)acetyl-CoA isomerase